MGAGLLGKKRLPGFLYVVERPGDEFGGAIGAGGDGAGAVVWLIHCGWMGSDSAATGEITADVVAACDQADDQQNDEADDSNATAAETAATRAAPVFDILA